MILDGIFQCFSARYRFLMFVSNRLHASMHIHRASDVEAAKRRKVPEPEVFQVRAYDWQRAGWRDTGGFVTLAVRDVWKAAWHNSFKIGKIILHSDPQIDRNGFQYMFSGDPLFRSMYAIPIIWLEPYRSYDLIGSFYLWFRCTGQRFMHHQQQPLTA